jgi:hypothetical protein
MVAAAAFDPALGVYGLPLALVLVPLLLRRYPGERFIARALAPAAARRRPPRTLRSRTRHVAVREQALAWSLATRPPPRLLASA